MNISNRIAQIAASPTLAMSAKAREMKQSGIDVLSMSVGEPDFPTPAHIKQAVKDAVDNDQSHYGPVPGTPGLRAAAAEYMSAGLDAAEAFKPEHVIVSVGAKQCLCNAIETLIGEGDEVILPTPCWVSYVEMVKLAQGVPVSVRTTMQTGFKLTPEALEAAITPRTRLLLICSPNNPTGAIYSAEDIRALTDVLLRHPQVVVLSDEIYDKISYVGKCPSWATITELHDRLIVVNGVSKAFAMTGYRIGWLCCKDKAFLQACTRLQGQQITCATVVAQYAAEVALRSDLSCVNEMTAAFRRRRDLVMSLARQICGWQFSQPDGAFYLFPDVTALFGMHAPAEGAYAQAKGTTLIANADDLCEYLLQDAHVACVSGAAFGEPTCIRLSYAMSDDQIREGLHRIHQAVDRLQK